MIASQSGRWDVLLADLALILFIVTLGGLVSMPTSKAAEKPKLAIAPSQALFRKVEGGPSIGEWLEGQPRDPRATVTIFVSYRPDDASASLTTAAQLIKEARSSGVAVRTVIKASDSSDIYASLAFDAVTQTPQ